MNKHASIIMILALSVGMVLQACATPLETSDLAAAKVTMMKWSAARASGDYETVWGLCTQNYKLGLSKEQFKQTICNVRGFGTMQYQSIGAVRYKDFRAGYQKVSGSDSGNPEAWISVHSVYGKLVVDEYFYLIKERDNVWRVDHYSANLDD
jgi:hypothetical protein